MSKKLITACLGLVALAAFALPSAASAAGPTVTHPTGTSLNPTGKKCTTTENAICITATNIGTTKLMTDPPNEEKPTPLVECSKAVMTGSLIKNSGGIVEGNIHTATFEGGGTGGKINNMEECKGSIVDAGVTSNGTDPVGTKTDNEDVAGGTPWCLRAEGAENKFTIRGGTCSEVAKPLTFILDMTFSKGVITECKYEKAAAVTGTFTTDTTGDAILSVKPGITPTEKAMTTFSREAGGSILCPATGTLEMSFTLETDSITSEPLYMSTAP